MLVALLDNDEDMLSFQLTQAAVSAENGE